jgi:tetratricopeptide (TPR) repeat protein
MENLLEKINSQPDNIDARMELAGKYLSEQDAEKAKPLLEEVLNIDSNNLNANFILAQIYEFDEEYSKAVVCMEKVVAQQPAFELVYRLGQLYEGADEYEKALNIYKNCYLQAQDDANLCERVAHTYRVLGNNTEATEFYKKLLTINKDDIVALTQLMEIHEEEGEKFLYYITRAKIYEMEDSLSQAISSYKKALNEAADNDEASKVRLAIIDLLHKKGNYNQAVDELLLLLEQDKNNYAAYMYLAEVYIKLDNTEAACEAYEKAHELNPNNVNLLNELADLYLDTEQAEKASTVLLKLIELEPDNLSSRVNYAKAQIALNQDDRAEESLNFVLKKDPQNVEATSVYADYYMLKKDYEKASTNVEKIKKLIPNSPFGYRKAGEICEIIDKPFESHYNYGIFHDLKGEKQLAIDEFTWALDHDPRNIEVSLKLAKLYEESSEEYVAVEYYQRVYKLDSENLTALRRMGEIYTKNKDYEQAIEVYKAIIKLNENGRDTYFSLAESYEQTRNYEKALEVYRKFVALAGMSAKADEARNKIEKLETRINGEEDDGLLNKIFKIFSR